MPLCSLIKDKEGCGCSRHQKVNGEGQKVKLQDHVIHRYSLIVILKKGLNQEQIVGLQRCTNFPIE
jgi:hypothetical protein